MGIRQFKPVTKGTRFRSVSDFAEITRSTPEKSLVEPLKKSGGRDNHGHISMRRIGGGHKRMYRVIDFKRNKFGVVGTVAHIEYDPNRSARIALIEYADGEKRYILHPKGLKQGDTVVSGPGSDVYPQFSYGAVIRKAIGNVLTKIVTAPFRALASLFGGSGEKLEAVDFDPGRDTLLPPEREKLQKVAQILAKRKQLKLLVPGQYSEAADGAALKARAVRAEIDKRAGIKLEAGERPGPLDLGDRAVRSALRSLYSDRFGAAELDKQKKAAEQAPASAGQKAPEKLPIWQRMGKMIQGEPQVADASAFYRNLRDRLNQAQPLPAGALTQLGTQRAHAIVGALTDAGVDPASVQAGAPADVGAEVGKPVALKLDLEAK